jgi:hypothetical protein
MEELIKYIESNKDIIISDKTHNLLTLKWEKNGAGFYLSIYEKNTCKYRCSGKIHVKDYCKDEVIESTIWRIVNSEKEIIKTLEELIDNLSGMQRYMIGKKIYGD